MSAINDKGQDDFFRRCGVIDKRLYVLLKIIFQVVGEGGIDVFIEKLIFVEIQLIGEVAGDVVDVMIDDVNVAGAD